VDPVEQRRLGDILEGLVSHHGWGRAQWLRMMEVIWHRVVGDTIYDHTRILTLSSDGVLLVAVPSSVWSQELLYYKLRILEAIHDELPQIPIGDVRTRVRSDVEMRRTKGIEPNFSPYFNTHKRISGNQDLQVLLASVKEKYYRATQDWLMKGLGPCNRCHAPTMEGYSLCVVCELELRQQSKRLGH